MGKNNVAVIDEAKDTMPEQTEPTTKKSYLKQADKLARRIDRLVTEMNSVSGDARSLVLECETPEVTDRDLDRFNEMATILESVTGIVYHLSERMARKYAGKEVKPIGGNKERKSLKKK